MNRLIAAALSLVLLSPFSAHGRFVQADKWMGADQQPITLNKYVYANADPVNGTDPSGQFTIHR